MKSFYDQEPISLEHDNDGSHIFRWNIEEHEDENHTGWKCDEIRFFGNPDRSTIKKAIIREKYDETKEFSLINKYNAHKEGIRIDEEAEANYLDYLNFTFDIDDVLEIL